MSEAQLPLVLVDMGSLFWPSWMATKSQWSAFSRTVDTVEAYGDDYPHVIVCCDAPRNWRHARTADLEKEKRYKANREKKDPEALIALRDAEDRLRKLGFPVVSCDNYEADDVIASLVEQAFLLEVLVVSEDKDLYQLIAENVTQITKRGRITPAACERKFGVGPEQIRDLLAICGDSSDNIEGCPGIGLGKAATLLSEFGSIEGIREAGEVNVGRVKGVGAKLVKSFFSWDPCLAVELVSLRTDCPVSLEELTRNEAA